MTATATPWAVGDRVAIFDEVRTIRRIETRSGLHQALAVPDSKEEASPFDWINVSLLDKYGRKSLAAPS